MKKIVLLCLFVIIVLVSFVGCVTVDGDSLSWNSSPKMSETEFREFCASYKEQLKNIDPSIEIYEVFSTLDVGSPCVDYTVSTNNNLSLQISFRRHSVDENEIIIYFDNPADNFTDRNIEIFCACISVFSHNDIPIEDLTRAVKSMKFSKRIYLHSYVSNFSYASFFWDYMAIGYHEINNFTKN